MERKTGFALAGAVAMVLVAGAIAAGLNLGVLGATHQSPAGKLRPVGVTATDNPPQVVTVEVRDPAGGATASVSGDSSEPDVQVVDVPIRSVPEVRSTGERSDDSEHEPSEDDGHESDD